MSKFILYLETRSDLTNQQLDKLADAFIDTHNQASKEYKKLFAEVGARLWHDDKAHIIKPQRKESMIAHWKLVKNIAEIIFITRPLTALDSYPNVTQKQREWLDREVTKVWKKYEKIFNQQKEDILNE